MKIRTIRGLLVTLLLVGVISVPSTQAQAVPTVTIDLATGAGRVETYVTEPPEWGFPALDEMEATLVFALLPEEQYTWGNPAASPVEGLAGTYLIRTFEEGQSSYTASFGIGPSVLSVEAGQDCLWTWRFLPLEGAQYRLLLPPGISYSGEMTNIDDPGSPFHSISAFEWGEGRAGVSFVIGEVGPGLIGAHYKWHLTDAPCAFGEEEIPVADPTQVPTEQPPTQPAYTATPIPTPLPTTTPLPTETPTLEPTATPTPSPTITPTPVPTPEPTLTEAAAETLPITPTLDATIQPQPTPTAEDPSAGDSGLCGAILPFLGLVILCIRLSKGIRA